MSLKLLYCCQKLLMDRDLKCFIRENFMQNPNILLVSNNFSYSVFETINLIDRNDGPITNSVILLNISNLLKPVEKIVYTRNHCTNLFITPLVLSHSGSKRISVVLTIMINKVLRNSTNLNIKDFITYLNLNLSTLFQQFAKFILVENFTLL